MNLKDRFNYMIQPRNATVLLVASLGLALEFSPIFFIFCIPFCVMMLKKILSEDEKEEMEPEDEDDISE